MPVGYLPDEEINNYAIDFLDNYHPANTLPVPIEEIAEFSLGLEIIPIPGLSQQFNVAGFLSNDFVTISVDDFVYRDRPTRYRFTLAHEIGHLIMHQDLLKEHALFDSVDGWKKFVTGMDNRDHGAYEYQGYAFAGYILVPKDHLRREFVGALAEIDQRIRLAKKQQIPRTAYLSYAIDEVASILAPIFDVSSEVMIRRIENDKLGVLIP